MTTIAETLISKGWTEQDTTKVKAVALEDGWWISPARHIEDKAEWMSLRVRVADLLPHGATITFPEGSATIHHSDAFQIGLKLPNGGFRRSLFTTARIGTGSTGDVEKAFAQGLADADITVA